MPHRKLKHLTILVVVAVAWWAAALQAGAAPLANGGFETGDFTSWTLVGGTTAAVHAVAHPPFAIDHALITTSGDVTQGVIEVALGLTPGVLDSLPFGDATTGGALFQTIDAVAGQSLTFDAMFASDEGVGASFTDFAFFSVVGPLASDVIPLGSTLTTAAVAFEGFSSSAPLASPVYTFPGTGAYTIGFGIMNEGDTAVESGLVVDNVVQAGAGAVPEIDASSAAAPLGVAFCLLLLAADRRRRAAAVQ